MFDGGLEWTNSGLSELGGVGIELVELSMEEGT